MAMENLRSLKRKRGSLKPKLDVNERVEVRGMEEGFQGSWHPGTVIQCGKLKRHVRYDNILDDDGVNYLVDKVIVSKELDGDSDSSNCCNMRGSIRPLPPLIEFEECELKFDLCVDVYHQEAWWDGVMFDHCDGMGERSVFFPDLGDEMKIGVHQMRITHDWDEVNGMWRRRGNWVFLELFEEFERTSFVAVSAKQVWYDVRVRKKFDRIRDWTYNVKEFWRDLVTEVVSDYLTLTVIEIYSFLDLPRSLQKETLELETIEPMANGNFNHKNASMRVLKPPPWAPGTRVAFRPPPIRAPCPRPTAVRPPPIRPTTATARPILHAPIPPPLVTSVIPTVVQPPSKRARSSPPPNEPITTETIETSPASTSGFSRFMRFMPTPGFKAIRKMD